MLVIGTDEYLCRSRIGSNAEVIVGPTAKTYQLVFFFEQSLQSIRFNPLDLLASDEI